MKRAILICGAALLALAACSKKTETASAAGGAGTPATANAPASSAGPGGLFNPPPRKVGLWEQKISSDRMQQTTKMCIDAAFDQKMKWWGGEARKSTDCSEQRVTPRLGGGFDVHSVCKRGETGTTTSDGTVTGDLGSHYNMQITTVTNGSPMPQANGTHKMTIEASWTGPCPPDMKAGDVELPGGMKINTLDAMAGRPAGMAAGGHMTAADIAKMKAQAMAMAKAAQEQQK